MAETTSTNTSANTRGPRPASKRPAAKKATAKKATAKKAVSKKTASKKAASKQTSAGRNGSRSGSSSSGRGPIQIQARRVEALAGSAKDKAQDLVERGKRFAQEHPAEAAGLAAAGLTVLGAILGRSKLGPVVKGVAGTALVAKVSEALTKRRK